ncbi:MAG: LD-carboxypeptidase [Anaeroplasmataceae bacterium]|nr:LD-carboxypeptidase [Anaeroplasmataceae bacterium]
MLPKHLKKGDNVAIVSLSSGILGESFIKHELDLGIKRLREFDLEPIFMPNALKGLTFIKEHPEARAEDLKKAFLDNSISAILCAIGGDDTYRTLPYLLEDEEFKNIVQKNPKLFLGFSDTTINHFMFYRLGLPTFYGQAFLPDLAELDQEMLPYSKAAFLNLFKTRFDPITSSPVWYLERHDFSPASLGTKRQHKEERNGYEVLQGKGKFEGELLGGCLDSMYDILTNTRYPDEKEICEKYHLFPSKEEWKGKILLLETSEEQPSPEEYRKMLNALKATGVFESIHGILHGKPMDEKYYNEYKSILIEIVDNPKLPILFNLNIGHATPRCILPLQARIIVDLEEKKLEFKEEVFL